MSQITGFIALFFSFFILSGCQETSLEIGDSIQKPVISVEPLYIEKPIAVVVHAYKYKTDDYKPLMSELSKLGYRAFLFHYDNHEALEYSTDELVEFVDGLKYKYQFDHLTIIGHGVGGLIARKSAVSERAVSFAHEELQVQLITIGSPFAGFKRAAFSLLFPEEFLNLNRPVYQDLSPLSNFISNAGKLAENAVHYKIITHEKNQTRILNDETVKDEFVSKRRQKCDQIDKDPQLRRTYRINAGHFGVINNNNLVSPELLEILEIHVSF